MGGLQKCWQIGPGIFFGQGLKIRREPSSPRIHEKVNQKQRPERQSQGVRPPLVFAEDAGAETLFGASRRPAGRRFGGGQGTRSAAGMLDV